ncbi:MAG TPA: VWA domain-containing protein, partial [Terracidiphilus sp.]|nr:VWA domain-containing protein [Terracidiphilus sp.]
MRRRFNRATATGTAFVLAMLPVRPQQAAPNTPQVSANRVSSTPQAGYTLQLNGELVLTNVVARDAKTGEVVRGLKQSDFRIYENGKEQKIATFDFQSVDMATPLNEATVSGLAAGSNGSGGKAVVVARPEQLRNHRLIVMFFDLTSMQPEDLERSVDAAQDFLRTRMQPADLVALVSLGDTLSVDQDFTADKNALIDEVGAYNGTE